MVDGNELIKAFWNCGDNDIIEYAIMRARLNRNEKKVVNLILDECMTQEQAAEELDVSVRWVQKQWNSAKHKLFSLPWLTAYGFYLLENA